MKHYPKIFEIFPIISFPFDGLLLRRVSGSVRVRVRVAAGSGSAPQGLLPRREALPGWRQGGGKFFRELDAPQRPPDRFIIVDHIDHAMLLGHGDLFKTNL
jgi:hypothetical protein